MAGTVLDKGKTIYNSGQPMTAVHLITKGKVRAYYPGGSYTLSKGDVIGVGEIGAEVHFLDYTVLEETSVLTYPTTNMDALADLLGKHPDMARLFILSLFRQINTLLNQSALSEMNCAGLYQKLMDDYQKYNNLCERYRIQAGTLDDMELAYDYIGEEAADAWLADYYSGLHHIYAGESHKIMLQESGLTMGILRKGSLDFRKTYSLLEDQFQYRVQMIGYYFNFTGKDLFGLYTELYYRLGQNCEDADDLYNDINQMIFMVESDKSVYDDRYTTRIDNFRNNVNILEASDASQDTDTSANSDIMAELAGSLGIILDYSGLQEDFKDSFRELLSAYQHLEDKSSMDDKTSRLRKKLTAAFYTLYTAVFERTLDYLHFPMPVKMFLNFGYVDENLAGLTNSITLYKLANELEDQTRFGVYTFYDWLLAIYNGQKVPSRNEFDEDFTEYLYKQKAMGNFTEAEVTAKEKDPMERVRYELQNMFPSVNKITFGRITTFCPVFSEDNVLKDLKASLVTLTQISKSLERIRDVDYSAFYRESFDYDNMNIMGKEIIHLEFLPDIILMPNVGIRGAMWQEIEGKKRNTPSRMLISIFHMEDIHTTMVRLAGEFRWELCKRVQGGRWNDVTERSLTSEYFDYIQFYKKNHDLSNEAKDKIRTSLQRAKNSFKEMFVRDYIVWVLYEGSGSPRLNKIARRILFTYCPFPASLNATLQQNPIYGELLDSKKVSTGQRLHHLELLQQKLRTAGIRVPETLEAEIKFTQGEI